MKRILEQITNTPCVISPISERERQVFSNIQHLQRYHSGIESFPSNTSVQKQFLSLPHPSTITEWLDTSGQEDPRVFRALIRSSSLGEIKEAPVFVKTVHLLDPIGLLHDEYVIPTHPLLPQGETAWKKTLQKLHSQSNQAYVDAVASYVIGSFRFHGMTPHGVLSYGSMTGIANSYKYCITDEYSSYRNCRWFWKGIKTQSAALEVVREKESILNNPEYTELIKNYFTCPPEFEADEKGDEDEILIPCLSGDAGDNDAEEKASIHSFNFDEDDIPEMIEQMNRIVLPKSTESESGSESGSESESESDSGTTCSSESTQYDIHLNIKSMPVILICQEAQEGTMDDLMELDVLDGVAKNTVLWEHMWTAWLFQVVSILTFLQKQICLTHNDLHTNNIVWRKTNEKFLYYRLGDGTVMKVPTFGRIFSLIDFGRAIFKLKGQLWVSDDHWPERDAGGQYNFGPFYSIEQPKVPPNPSFDLCRLAISMLEGLYDERPNKKKGRDVPVLSQEGSWKVYETVSPLYNLLWRWTLNDDGQTLFEDEQGDEKFPGFEMYIQIAHHVHDAVPREQLRKPIFEGFRMPKGEKIGASVTVYAI